MVKRWWPNANTFRYIQIWSVSVQVFNFLLLSSTNLETKSCQTVAGGEYESRRSRVEQVFLLFFLYIPKFVQNDKNWIWKLQFREIPFSAAVASAASRCDEHLRWRAHRTGSNFRLVCTVCCTCCTGSVFNLADLTLFRVVSGARQLKAMEVMEMPAIQQAKPTGGRYWNKYNIQGDPRRLSQVIFFLTDLKITKKPKNWSK